DVLAIDFSPDAVALARQHTETLTDRVLLADFFTFDAGKASFDLIYKRAFLCALPRKLWTRYAERIAELLTRQQRLAKFFFYGDNPKNPPFSTNAKKLHDLLDTGFEQIEDRPATEQLPVFQGEERWQMWQQR